jgi:hypothetical protein
MTSKDWSNHRRLLTRLTQRPRGTFRCLGRNCPPSPQCVSVSSVKIGATDRRGRVIARIYILDPSFAVYGTTDEQDKGLTVQFSDDNAKAEEQRAAFAKIDPLLTEIAALLTQWRGYQVERARLQMASAVRAALTQKDARPSLDILEKARLRVIKERELRGRSWSLAFSFVTAFTIAAFLIAIVRCKLAFDILNLRFAEAPSWAVILLAGMVGALFSSVIAVRRKSEASELNRLENFVDGGTRVFVGAVAAGILLLLVQTGIVPGIHIGTLSLGGGKSSDVPGLLLLGFVAGFSERLVPDLFGKKVWRDRKFPLDATPPSTLA